MLIKIALCEDSLADQKEIVALLNDYTALSAQQFDLQTFTDTIKLIGAIDDNFEAFDLYLLDIEMKTPREGLELARRIRTISGEIPIIFVTSHTELTYDSYDVFALHFIAKPIDRERFFAALDRFTHFLKQRKESSFSCTIDGNKRSFPLHEILYFQTDGHYLLINGDISLRLRMKLSELTRTYPQFVICYQSFAVNIAHIRTIRFAAQIIVLSDGTEIPASKMHLVAVRQRFEEFYSNI